MFHGLLEILWILNRNGFQKLHQECSHDGWANFGTGWIVVIKSRSVTWGHALDYCSALQQVNTWPIGWLWVLLTEAHHNKMAQFFPWKFASLPTVRREKSVARYVIMLCIPLALWLVAGFLSWLCCSPTSLDWKVGSGTRNSGALTADLRLSLWRGRYRGSDQIPTAAASCNKVEVELWRRLDIYRWWFILFRIRIAMSTCRCEWVKVWVKSEGARGCVALYGAWVRAQVTWQLPARRG